MSVTGKKTEAVTIKGTADGLLIRVRDDLPAEVGFSELLAELDERLAAGDRFFRRGRATVELGGRVLEESDLGSLRVMLARYEIELEAIVSGANATRALVKGAGLPFRLPNGQNTRPAPPKVEGAGSSGAGAGAGAGQPFDSAESLFLRRTLRSGQQVRHHADIVVLGDLNPGAEIIAGGSVIVWGSVRGKIEAGAVGGTGAVICALSLRPTQLRIGGVLAVGNPETLADPEIGPEIARVQDGAIVVESWMPKRKRF